MKKVELQELQVIEESQHGLAGGWNCFPGIGLWCGSGCFGVVCW